MDLWRTSLSRLLDYVAYNVLFKANADGGAIGINRTATVHGHKVQKEVKWTLACPEHINFQGSVSVFKGSQSAIHSQLPPGDTSVSKRSGRKLGTKVSPIQSFVPGRSIIEGKGGCASGRSFWWKAATVRPRVNPEWHGKPIAFNHSMNRKINSSISWMLCVLANCRSYRWSKRQRVTAENVCTCVEKIVSLPICHNSARVRISRVRSGIAEHVDWTTKHPYRLDVF